ncbi:MAG TPA: hemin uptake protein HemP [Rhizobacter sp.]|nr:hemin uptake protein HemP [Rhizobacter sp.]
MSTPPVPTDRPAPEPLPRPAPTAGEAVQRISSDVLLAGAQEVQIEHRGTLYRLRQTSLGKLILTK